MTVQDRAAGTDRRLLVINPNTNPEVTRRIADHVREALPAATRAEVVNPDAGPISIETMADRDCATPRVLDLIREKPDRDGYLLACFDDIAVAEARLIVRAPVVSMAQAAIEEAVAAGRRYVVITTVEDQVPAIGALLAKYDLGRRGSVRACRIGVAEAGARSKRAEALLDLQIQAAIEEDGADVIVLGSGAYAGRAGALGGRYGVRFVDGLSAALAWLTEAPNLIPSGGKLV